MKDPTLKAIRRASREKPPPGHSEAFKWLLDRHVEFAQVLRQDRPGWETIQEKLHAAGVVGKQPVLQPGESFSYTSGCPLTTPDGLMAGTYTITTIAGESFEAEIPAFSLDSPHVRRSLH